MGTRPHHGFTIIEVMLFLAVSGLLAVGILVGAGLSIGQQRYRDSVSSLKSFLQEQYSQTSNVVNTRNGAWTCDSLAGVTEKPLGGGEPRGTSDCVMLGRFVIVSEDGTRLTATNVVGYALSPDSDAISDITELQTNYRLGISSIDQEENDVAWGAQIVKPKTATPMPLSVLIIRSPLSGAVMTFSAEGTITNLNSLVSTDNLKVARDLCVNAEAGSFVGKRLEVQITPYTSNQGGIIIPPESASICD